MGTGFGLAVWVVALLGGQAVADAAGFREIETGSGVAGVWYPSDAPVTAQKLGPFDVDMARDAPVREGMFQAVLLSHGNGGRYRNHHLTARALADAGFVVIAPQHGADAFVGGRRTVRAMAYRYGELAAALAGVREDPAFRNRLATGPVHGVGYSLGGTAILLASGAAYDTARVRAHCRTNRREDRAFCKGRGVLHRVMQTFRRMPGPRKVADPFRGPPLVTGQAVVVAPVYQGVDAGAGLSVRALTVIAIGGDRIAQPVFHSRPLADAAEVQVPTLLLEVPGHHYAFIAPFPEWLTEEEHIPVAEDPEDFDRGAFIREVNALVEEALRGDCRNVKGRRRCGGLGR